MKRLTEERLAEIAEVDGHIRLPADDIMALVDEVRWQRSQLATVARERDELRSLIDHLTEQAGEDSCADFARQLHNVRRERDEIAKQLNWRIDAETRVSKERDELRATVHAWLAAEDDETISGEAHWEAERKLRALVAKERT